MVPALVCSMVLCCSPFGSAQNSQPDPWEQARYRTGPLAFSPTFNLTNLGWDSNVFNEVEDPKGDFTVRGDTALDWWLRAGDLRVHGLDRFEGVYFANYSTESAFNQYHDLTLEYRLNRIRPYVSGTYRNVKDRPGYEIDARARHTETALRGGLVARLTAKTSLDLSGGKTTFRFIGDDVFEGTSLAEQLNRTAVNGSVSLRYALTPLTTLSVTARAEDERFDQAPLRDNKSFKILPTISFDPMALLKGTVQVGYRWFNALAPTVPDYSGVVANVTLSYLPISRTRLSGGINRDIAFSFEVNQPYYLLTSTSGAVRQVLGWGWDFEVRGSRQTLAYRTAQGIQNSPEGRVDHVNSYGGGLGYRLARGLRLAFNVDQYQRRSDVGGYNYDALRYGLGATYEF